MRIKINRRFLLLSLAFLFFENNLYSRLIVDPDSMCINNTGVFTPSAGYSLSNLSTDYTIISFTNGNYHVKFLNLGLIALTFNQGGNSYTKDVYIYEPRPYISVSVNLSCTKNSMPVEGGSNLIISGKSTCQKVCDSSCLWYYAGSYSQYNNKKFKWIVYGAKNVLPTDTITGDSILICWGTSSLGEIILIEESPDSCIESVSGCVEIMANNRTVDFGIPPDMNLDIYYVCVDQDVNFLDISTMRDDPDVESWCWDFGNGDKYCGSVELDGLPPEVFVYNYAVRGVYHVRLSYITKCGCEKVKERIVKVDIGKRLEIYCNNPACYNEVVEYHTDSFCNQYEWSVENGTIIGSNTGKTVKIEWGDPENGIGIISVKALGSCQVCNPIVAQKINILPSNPKLIYPKFACAGSLITHTGILMPNTKYRWDGDIHSSTKDSLYYANGVVPSSNFLRKSELTGTYNMTLFNLYGDTMCYSNKNYLTIIQDTFDWIGPDTVCKNSSAQYSINLSIVVADSILVEGPNNFLKVFKNTNSISLSFPNSGVYIIKAKDSFLCDKGKCIKEVIVPIMKNVDSIVGDTEVCLNTYYTYKAYTKSPGYKLQWLVEGGSCIGSSASEATFSFNTLGKKRIGVVASMLFPPYCSSDTLWQDIYNPKVKKVILGPSSACANGTTSYKLEETRGVQHEWSILPNSNLGSIKKIDYRSVNIDWSNVTPQTVTLRVVFVVCGKKDTVDKQITITAPPSLTINGPNFICEGGNASYNCNISGGASSYEWSNPNLVFNNPTGQSTGVTVGLPGSFSVNLKVYSTACASLVNGSKIIQVLPKPASTISIIGSTNYCLPGPPNSVTVNVAVISNGSYSFNPNPSITTNNSTDRIIITDNNTGCTSTTPPVNFTGVICGSTGTKVTPCLSTPAPVIVFNTTVNCGVANFTVTTAPGSGSLTGVTVKDIRSGTIITGTSGSFTYPTSGTYEVQIEGKDASGCTIVEVRNINVLVAANSMTSFVCVNGIKKLVLRDISVVQSSSITINSVTWNITGPLGYALTASGQNYTTLNTASLAPGVYNIIMTIQTGGSVSQTCTHSTAVTVSPDYVPTFTVSSNVCSGNTIQFVLTSPSNIMSAIWDFKDGSTFHGGAVVSKQYNSGSPITFHPSVTITDVNNCFYTSSPVSVFVIPNLINVSLTPDKNNVCVNQKPVTLNASANSNAIMPHSYFWNNRSVSSGNSSYQVNNPGRYFVVLKDGNGCVKESSDIAVNFIDFPVIEGSGSLSYCQGDNINLVFDAGTSPVSIFCPTLGFFGNRIAMKATTPGKHILTISAFSAVGCTTTITREINVYPNPNLRIFNNRLSCKPYKVELVASGTPNPASPFSTAYVWKNAQLGQTGPTIQVEKGGIYELKYTNDKNCNVSKTTEVEKELKIPDGFPGGCVQKPCKIVCYDPSNTKPYVLNLNYDRTKYDHWKWERDGIIIAQNTNSLPINPFTAAASSIGRFTFVLTLTHNGCTVRSPDLVVEVINCCNFTISDPIPKPKLCGNEVTLSPNLSIDRNLGFVYKWFFNGNLISSATNSFYKVTQLGFYKVEATIMGCTKDFTYEVIPCPDSTDPSFKIDACSDTSNVCFSYFLPNIPGTTFKISNPRLHVVDNSGNQTILTTHTILNNQVCFNYNFKEAAYVFAKVNMSTGANGWILTTPNYSALKKPYLVLIKDTLIIKANCRLDLKIHRNHVAPDPCIENFCDFNNLTTDFSISKGFDMSKSNLNNYVFLKIDSNLNFDCKNNEKNYSIHYKRKHNNKAYCENCNELIILDFSYKCICNPPECPPPTRVNPYLNNLAGNWQAQNSYAYNTKRVTDPDRPVKDGQYFENYNPILAYNGSYWSMQDKDNWISKETNVSIDFNGQSIESNNPLKIPSSAKFSFKNSLVNHVASNASSKETFFLSNEDDGMFISSKINRSIGNRDKFDVNEIELPLKPNLSTEWPFISNHWHYNISIVEQSKDEFHTGVNSLKIVPKDAGQSYTYTQYTSCENRPVDIPYCPTVPNTPVLFDIVKVNLENLNNSTSCYSLSGSQGLATGELGKYSDFTKSGVPIPKLYQKQTYPLEVHFGKCANTMHDALCHVFIDWNQNGMFTDLGESFLIKPTLNSVPSSNPFSVLYNLKIPLNALPGKTRMRLVYMVRDSLGTRSDISKNPCAFKLGTSYGEIEDYMVDIIEVEKSESPKTVYSITDSDVQINVNSITKEFSLQKDKEYLLSYWVKDNQTSNKIGYIDLIDNPNEKIIPDYPFRPSQIEGWHKVEKVFRVTNDQFKLTFFPTPGSANPTYFDDIRIQPVDASMKGYVYDEKTQRLVSELDENNYATFYDYDEEGQLIRVRKETERGIMTIKESRKSLKQ